MLALHENRVSQTMLPVSRLSFDAGHGLIEVVPDEMLMRDGTKIVRTIRTGHAGSKSTEDWAATAFVLAAAQHPDRPVPHQVFLGDGTFDPIDLKGTKLNNRREKITEALGNITAGAFATDPNPRSCPGCPAFFFCGPVPDGRLTKKMNSTLPNSGSGSD